ncbi:MAG: hypothetical protein QG640_367 [Patescibacteria group bacterium]|nr:hypothetical protein [Patescibacteria group bacterium]
MKKTLLVTGAIVALFAAQTVRASYTDTFDSLNPGWTTDRYEPLSFGPVSFLGGNWLKVTPTGVNSPSPFDSTFYRTQGRQIQTLVNSSQWAFSFDQYVPTEAVSGNNLRRSDGWGRFGDVGVENANTGYMIMGYKRFDNADPFNPLAGGITSAFRVWDADTANGWVELGTPVTAGVHSWLALFNGSSIQTYLDGNLVYTDTTLTAGASSFTSMFAQAYNFSDGPYDAHFDNMSITAVPEPTSTIMLGGVGVLALLHRIRQRK